MVVSEGRHHAKHLSKQGLSVVYVVRLSCFHPILFPAFVLSEKRHLLVDAWIDYWK